MSDGIAVQSKPSQESVSRSLSVLVAESPVGPSPNERATQPEKVYDRNCEKKCVAHPQYCYNSTVLFSPFFMAESSACDQKMNSCYFLSMFSRRSRGTTYEVEEDG